MVDVMATWHGVHEGGEGEVTRRRGDTRLAEERPGGASFLLAAWRGGLWTGFVCGTLLLCQGCIDDVALDPCRRLVKIMQCDYAERDCRGYNPDNKVGVCMERRTTEVQIGVRKRMYTGSDPFVVEVTTLLPVSGVLSCVYAITDVRNPQPSIPDRLI